MLPAAMHVLTMLCVLAVTSCGPCPAIGTLAPTSRKYTSALCTRQLVGTRESAMRPMGTPAICVDLAWMVLGIPLP